MQHLQTFLIYSSYITVGAVILEVALAYMFNRANAPDTKEAAANMAVYGIGKLSRDVFIRAIELALLGLIYAATPLKIPMTVTGFLVTLLAVEFVYYWKHRTEHQVRLYWAYHSVHHSSEEYNLSTALRLPWFGYMLASATFYAPLVLLGFNPLMVLVARQLVLLYQFWIHTGHIGKLGWFDRVFNSPSNHRVHHASNGRYLDKNHGGIFIIWDRMFGTYEPERDEEPVRYGLTKNIGTQNPLMINLVEPLKLWRDVRDARTWQDKLSFVFKGPGWHPVQSMELAPQLQPSRQRSAWPEPSMRRSAGNP